MDLLQQLKEAASKRSKEFYNVAVENWDLPRWGNAVSGECGEMCNIIKKIDLGQQQFDRDGITPLNEALELEIGDVAIYLNLLAERAGVDFGECIAKSFNKKSKELGCSYFIKANAKIHY